MPSENCSKEKIMKKILFSRIFQGIVFVLWAYVLWIKPHLNSATPLRDMAKSFLVVVLPLFLTIGLIFWFQSKLIAQFKKMPPLPENWHHVVPKEWTILILKMIVILIVGLPLGFYIFSWLTGKLATIWLP